MNEQNPTKVAASSYWMTPIYDTDTDSILLHKLASNLRGVSKFVSIVTGKRYPVRFSEKDESYTDGKTVVISSKIKDPHDLDVQCGLALHEGSHCLLTDFTILPTLVSRIPSALKNKAKKLGVPTQSFFKNLLNFVEDRRIDYHIYEKNKGFRGYYKSMYDNYFNSPTTDVGLLSDEYRTETVDSYMFRLINITNPKSQLDALKSLREIYKTLGLKTIDRLKDTEDALEVAFDIGKLILDSVDPQLQQEENEANEKRKAEQGEGSGGGDGEAQDPKELTDEEFEQLLEQLENSNGGSGGSGGTPIKLTPEQAEKLRKKFEQQKDFVDGKAHKESLSSEEAKAMKTLSESGSDLKQVGAPQSQTGNAQSARANLNKSDSAGKVDGGEGFGSYNGVTCVVVNKMTRKLMESGNFPMVSSGYGGLRDYCGDAIEEGIRRGTALGRKLQVRSESRETVYNHQKTGKIDKRRLSGLGYGVEDVFFHKEIDMFNTCNLHISVDASGSMGGNKWNKTMSTVAALCKAVDMISNLEIQVTFRTTDARAPYVVQAYDSRVDKFNKVKTLFRYLQPNGTTPEGLCFEAIMDNFLEGTHKFDSFFLNISDGQPYFSTSDFYYSGNAAARHTRRMVANIEAMGIRTLSYFMDETRGIYSSDETDKRLFRDMYGKGAAFIDTQSVGQITKTINKLFMSK